MDEIAVLVVDDSALMRNLISRIINGTQGLTVADKAMNGQFALEKIEQCKPDIIVLDIEMPVMNGIEFLKERKRRGIDIPVIILSSIASKGAAVTMECLELGASDFITKPSGSESHDLSQVAVQLTERLLSYGYKYAKKYKNLQQFASPQNKSPASPPQAGTAFRQNPATSSIAPSSAATAPSVQQPAPAGAVSQIKPLRDPGKIEIIVIGISTGGPNALREVFAKLDPHLKRPILVVQHMPVGFTEEFANSLNSICPLEVQEATDKESLKPGRILIAPGNKHIYLEQLQYINVVRLSDAEQRNGHRPSVDVLFESVAKIYQNRALGIIMTGMGKDGAVQLAEMRRQGAHTLGQDEESSIVYGMPKVAYELGAVQRQVPLSQMAAAINQLARDYS